MKPSDHAALYLLTPLLLGGTCLISSAQTRPVAFRIDAIRSQIVLSGSITAAGFASVPIYEQSPGSLTASYEGTLNAWVDAQSIQLTGASTIVARITGNWQPACGGIGGSEPANYGGRAEVSIPFVGKRRAYAALRGVLLDLSSPPLPVASGSFDASAMAVSFSADNVGSLDFKDDFGDSGTLPLTGSVANTATSGATLSEADGVQTLRIPLDAYYPISSGELAGSKFHLVGQIQASRLLAPPRISSILVTNQTVVLKVASATSDSQVEISNDLVCWWPVSANVSTNANLTVFSTPFTGEQWFFRIRQ